MSSVVVQTQRSSLEISFAADLSARKTPLEIVMQLKTLILAGAAAIVLAGPATAFADPEWRDGDRWEHHYRGWGRDRDDDWRRHEWREHERWEHRWARRWDGEWVPETYYAPRCYWRNETYRTWWGGYEVRRVNVCS